MGVRHYRSSRLRAAPRIDEESHMPSTHIIDLATLTRSGDPDMPTSPPKPQQHRQLPDFSQPPQSPPAGRSRLAGRRAGRHGRAAARRPRLLRPAFRALLLAGAVAAMLGLPAVAQAATQSAARPAAAASVQARAQAGVPARAGAPARAGTPMRAAVPATPTAPSGGVCSVPGIGDIGGLLGFCAAGSAQFPASVTSAACSASARLAPQA